jgi:hypothetical protein
MAVSLKLRYQYLSVIISAIKGSIPNAEYRQYVVQTTGA